MKKIHCFLVAFALLLALNARESASQFRLTDWISYTSFNYPQDAASDGDNTIWVGTTGGLYSRNIETGEVMTFQNTDGLLSMQISAVEWGEEINALYAGTYDGVLEIYSPEEGWTHILSIKDNDYPDSRITDFLIRGNEVFIAGGFGLATFDHAEKVFRETILRIGSFETNTKVNDMLIINNDLWLATNSGIAMISLDAPNFSPEFWKNYTETGGLKNSNITHVESFNGVVYAASETEIYRITPDSAITVLDKENTGISAGNDRMYISDRYGFGFLDEDYNYIPIDVTHPGLITGIRALGFSRGELPAVIYESAGLSLYENDEIEVIRPNSPVSNVFQDISVDISGNLWASTDGSKTGQGFMRFDGTDWKIYDDETMPGIQGILGAFRVSTFRDGRVLIGTWGAGCILGTPNDTGFHFVRFYKENSPMINDFNVIGQAKMDSEGSIWFMEFGASSMGTLLYEYDSDGNFHTYQNRSNSMNRAYLNMEIDNFDTKWLGAQRQGHGLYYFNESRTPDNPSDDSYGTFTTANSSLQSMTHNTLAFDRNGMLWVGTSQGASVIINPSSVLSSANTVIKSEVRELQNVSVNDIYVDALNYKWIATNEGVWIFNEDGTELMEIITAEDTPLISDEVVSITADDRTGRIYFGTRSGLSSASSLSIMPNEEFDIFCYPQPFNPDMDEEMVIDGLARDTELRIITVNGELVRKISSIGRTAVWDGLDSRGNKVKSGVYLILSDSESTGESAVAKFAVIRK